LSNQESDRVIKRQCFDIPPVQIEVTEHQAQAKVCPHCNHQTVAKFPENVVAPAYYGDNLKSYVAYLHSYQMCHMKESANISEIYVTILYLKRLF